MRKQKNILYIGAEGSNLDLIQNHLDNSDLITVNLQSLSSLKEGLTYLEERHDFLDLTLLELDLPDSQGLETYRSFKAEFPSHPVILIVRKEQYEIGLTAIQEGVFDFVIIENLQQNHVCQLLARTVKHAIEANQLAIRLQEAQHLAKAGDWEVNVLTNEFICSQEVFHIFESEGLARFTTLEDYIQAVFPEDQEKVVRSLLEALKHGDEFVVEHRIATKDQKVKYVSMQGYALADDAGNYTRLKGITQDISLQKRTQKLQEDKEVIEQSAKFKQDFLAKTSHEIRTPLNPILLLTNILLNTKPSPQQQEHLHAIKTAGEILLAVVNDVLDVSKIEAGKIEFNRNVFQLSQVFSALREMMELNAREKSLDIIFELDEEIPDYVIGDNVRLTQILLNLIGNAIKFTPKGYIRVEARKKSESDQKIKVEFKVNDTGIGIPEDKLVDIFESFNQVNTSFGERYHGSGLGLSIVKQLIKLQGGDIFVSSKLNEGSTFTFELDFEPAEDHKEEENIPEEIAENSLADINILLVEDNPLNQLVTKKIVNVWGGNVEIANNGKECLEILANRTFDLILMDLEMPEMDGYEATEHIRHHASQDIKDIPIIALTANAMSGMDNKCVEIGMNDYIAKPFDPSNLFKKIIKFVGKKEKKTTEQQTPELSNTEVNGSNRMKQQDQSLPDLSSIIQEFMGTAPYTDLSYLKGISMGDNAIVRKAVSRYLKDTPELMLQMEASLKAGDYDQLGKHAHKLKSSVGIMGMDPMKESMQKIVNICRSDLDKSMLNGLVQATSEVIKVSIQELENELATM